MGGFAGRGNCAGHRRVGHDPFQEKLRPRAGLKFRGPIRHWFGAHLVEKISCAKGPVCQDGDPPIACQWQNPLRSFRLQKRVIDLDKIELLAANEILHLFERAGFVMRDPDVANAPLSLPIAQGRKVRLYLHQVVHLHQVDSIGAQQRHRALHGVDSLLPAARPDFGGEKKFIPNPQRGGKIADHLLGPAVHGRCIHHAAAQFYKERKHLLQPSASVCCRINVECPPRAQPDHRQFFARNRNRPRNHVQRLACPLAARRLHRHERTNHCSAD